MPYTIPFYAYTTSRFGDTAGRTNPHRGHDVAPGGQDFPAWVSGTVVTAGYHSCLGNRVVIRNDADGHYIGVSHLANLKVKVGQWVAIGTLLGNIGATGGCQNGRHAHITVSSSSAYPESGPVQDPVTYANNALANTGGNANYGYGLTKACQTSLQKAMTHVKRYFGPIDGAFGMVSVKAMQQWLMDMGYLPATYKVDGLPGELYGKALQNLAKAKGGYTGVIDGKPGSATSTALIHWAEVVVIQNGGGTSEDYGYGLTMEAQRQMQKALHHIGYYDGVVDGVFGPRSVAAMQEYLKFRGILPASYGVDGIPGTKYAQAVQTLASKHGYDGPIDGVIGDRTSAAMVEWARVILATPVEEEPDEEEPKPKWPEHGTFGIDVASPQRDIDFVKAKAEGVEFVIIKMGGLNVEPQYVAPYYKQQVDRARAAGLKIGHYYVIGAGQNAEQQAGFFVRNLHDFRADVDVLVIDNERLDSNAAFFKDPAAARFIAEVKRLTGVVDVEARWHYANADDYRVNAPWTDLGEAWANPRIWWASYGANDGTRDHEPDLQGSVPAYHVHQFSSTVAIAGYKLDGNWSPLELTDLFGTWEVEEVDDEEPPVEPDLAAIGAAAVHAAADLKVILTELGL
jgi:GH25 family lysozyme M1 (1,4-beta-N-acetylmuramidase)/peptidoglycan hydrolase-like protein with peptidoglycan-binding domain